MPAGYEVNAKKNAILSVIAGLAGLFLGYQIIFGLLALYLGFNSKKYYPSTAKTGMAIGVVTLVLGLYGLMYGFSPLYPVSTDRMAGTLGRGDLVLLEPLSPGIGDQIVYNADKEHKGEKIFSRIKAIGYVEDGQLIQIEGDMGCLNRQDLEDYVGIIDVCRESISGCVYHEIPKSDDYMIFVTGADNRDYVDQCGPRDKFSVSFPVNQAQIGGGVKTSIPLLGWVSIILTWIIYLPSRIIPI